MPLFSPSPDLAGLARAGIVGNIANTFAYMGDSRVASMYNDGPKRNKNAGSFLVVANTQVQQRMVTLTNTAVAGQRSDQYISTLETTLATKPRFLMFFGVVNDLGQAFTAVAAWASVKTIIDTAISRGITVITCTEPGATNFTTAMIAERNDFNARLLTYAQTKVGLFVFDYARLLVDPTATAAITFKANLSYDGVHLTNAGAQTIGTAYAAFISPLLANVPTLMPIDGMSFTGTANVLKNGLFLTTTGGSTVAGITGPIPASWGMGKAGTGAPTATVSTGAAPDGIGNELIIAASGTIATDRIQVSQSVTTGLALSDTVRAICEVSVDAGSTNLRSVRAYVTAWTDGVTVSNLTIDMQPITLPANTVSTAYTCVLPALTLQSRLNLAVLVAPHSVSARQ
jgi:hypothetical protein